MADIPVFIDSDETSSERRVSPSWSLATFKQKMWPITGIPPDCQILSLPGSYDDETLLESFELEAYTAIRISDTRPKGSRPNYTDDSNVDKYELSTAEYEERTDSVLAYKKRHQLGRFNPDLQAREEAALRDLQSGGVVVGARCKVDGDAGRLGTVAFVGHVPEIPAGGGLWIGVVYDEPVGKNDGSINGTRYFQTKPNHGGFLRPGKVLVGDFPPIDIEDELMDSEDEV
ncbi:hypothetical protein PYCC9005_001955 [Savitreella phatthalungensis]